MANEKELFAALDKVIHPTFGMSVVTLNMVRSVSVSEKGIQVKMVMNCPGCPAGKVTLAHVHRVIRPLLGSDQEEVIVTILPRVWEAPWEF